MAATGGRGSDVRTEPTVGSLIFEWRTLLARLTTIRTALRVPVTGRFCMCESMTTVTPAGVWFETEEVSDSRRRCLTRAHQMRPRPCRPTQTAPGTWAGTGEAAIMSIITGPNRSARPVRVHDRGRICVMEVDGELDLVSGYALRHAFATALRSASVGAMTLDLSRVTAIDDQGLASLEWCAILASDADRKLEWTHPDVREVMPRLAPSRHASPAR